MFYEHLADADDAALKRLLSYLVHVLPPFCGRDVYFSLPVHKSAHFHGRDAKFARDVHKNAYFHGRSHPRAANLERDKEKVPFESEEL